MIVSVYNPATLVPVFTFKVEPPEPPGTNVGASVHDAPVGHPVTVRLTESVNPPREVTVMVEGPEFPCVSVNDDGFADSEKSGVAGRPHPVNLNDPMCVYQP